MRCLMQTPIGTLRIEGAPRLRCVRFVDAPVTDSVETDATYQLREYFEGTRTGFDLPEFQRAVWREVAGIAFAETRTYLEIATKLWDPHLTRGVGAANGANPPAIVIGATA